MGLIRISSCAYDLHLGGVGFAGGAAGELGGLALEEQFVVASVAGGTASSLPGGKFANGALTSAFGFVFNQVQHRAAQKRGQPRLTILTSF